MNDAMDAMIDHYCMLVENGNFEQAIRLVEDFDEENSEGSFVNLHFDIYGTNALNVAANNGAVALVKFLAERATMNGPDDTVRLDEVLFFAKDAATVDVLVAAGGNVNALNDRGRTPLHLATRMDRIDVLEALARNGADLDARDISGRTAAMTAAEWGQAGALDALARHGANLTGADDDGFDALSLALKSAVNRRDESKSKACVSVLLDAGIDPRVPTSRGEMPLDLVRASRGYSIVALLETKCLELNEQGRGGPARKGYAAARSHVL